MSAFREGQVRCIDPKGFHWMRYTEWGDRGNHRVLVCVHGLTRCGRDFDHLAQSLADAYRVVCPDIVGRGRSDWLANPADYSYPVYCGDLTTLIAKVGAETVDWVGTSMGGILGMILASLPGSPVRKLVVNDVGSVIPRAALDRLGQYVGNAASFDSFEALTAAIRNVSPFGELTDEQWTHLALHVSRRDDTGRWIFRYDPGIGKNFHAARGADVDFRPIWNAIPGPVLVMRGADSDLLRADTLEEMRRRKHTETFTVPRTGHAPMLMDDSQVAVVRRFLLG